MRITAIIILLLSFGLSVSQNPFPLTGPRVDTNYYLHLEVRPDNQLYEYYYNTKVDTLEFVMWKDKKRTSVKVYVETKFKKFLIDELIYGFDKLKLDKNHKPVSQDFSVFCIVHHNHSQKQVDLGDKYYLEQILPTLLKFNNTLPTNARFENNFNYTIRKTSNPNSVITIDVDHSEGTDNKRDKILYGDVKYGVPFQLNYFDQSEQKKKNKVPIQFDNKTLDAISSKSLDFVNSFSIKGKTFSKTTDTLEVFGVEYSFPGIYMNTKITSLEKAFKNKKCIDLIGYLNSKLDIKYKFE